MLECSPKKTHVREEVAHFCILDAIFAVSQPRLDGLAWPARPVRSLAAAPPGARFAVFGPVSAFVGACATQS
eukprot:3258600-Pyramimonas_sp.AAC.1